MNNEEKTFGHFLRSVLESRGMSIRRLAALMEMKSKTQLQRIVEDESSYRSIVRFAEQLEQTLGLSEAEKREMTSAIAVHRVPPDVRAARSSLRTLIMREPKVESVCRCTFMNGEECRERIYLEDLVVSAVESHSSGAVSIYIENMTGPELVEALTRLTHSRTVGELKIYHFFRDSDDKRELSAQLIALFRLAPFIEYYPYALPKNLVKNRRMMIFCEDGGATHLFSLYTPTGFGYLCEKTSASAQKHLRADYERLIEKSMFMTKERFNVPLENLPDFLDAQRNDDDLTAVSLEASPSFMTIPFYIQKRLYEDSDYMGLGKDAPIIQRMYKVLKARSEKLYVSGINKLCVYDRKAIARFLESGRTDDYFPFFRPLTKEERLESLEAVLRVPGLNIHILNEDYKAGELLLVAYESKFISVMDPRGGYWKNYSQITITNRDMVRLLHDFITDDVVPNCCLSEENSRKLIAELVEKAR